VREAEDKDPLLPGRVYLAPPRYHLLVERGKLALSTEAPDNYAQPSIDVLFESAAASYREGVVGVLLTGSNADGAQGLSAIKRAGGLAIVQDPETAEARAMPDAAIARGAADMILPLCEIGVFLAGLGGSRWQIAISHQPSAIRHTPSASAWSGITITRSANGKD